MTVRPIDAMELKQRMCALCTQDYSDEPCEPSDCVFVRAINETPTLTPPNEWVSVEERLPEKNAQVLMWSARWNIAEAGSYYNRRFWVYSEIGDAYVADNITHWMSLPEPPDHYSRREKVRV